MELREEKEEIKQMEQQTMLNSALQTNNTGKTTDIERLHSYCKKQPDQLTVLEFKAKFTFYILHINS